MLWANWPGLAEAWHDWHLTYLLSGVLEALLARVRVKGPAASLGVALASLLLL